MRKRIFAGLLATFIGIQGLGAYATGEELPFEDVLSDGSEYEVDDIVVIEAENEDKEELDDDIDQTSIFEEKEEKTDNLPDANLADSDQDELTADDAPSAEDESDNILGVGTSQGSCGTDVIYTLDLSGVLTISGKGSISRFPWTDINDRDKVKRVVIQQGVTSIGSYGAFALCRNLSSITIPDSVTSIGSDTFHGCSSLTSITIPNSVTSIGGGAFYGCTNLTNITLPRGLTKIGFFSFYNCKSLSNILIPDSVAVIEEYAFYGCSSFSNITIPDSVTVIENYAFSKCTNSSSITLSNQLMSIGEHVFDNCSSLKSIRVPNSVTSIDRYAFNNCDSLTSITIPSSVTSIADHAFSKCSNLTSVMIPDSVTSIPSYAFYECSNLTSVMIPDSVTDICDHAFANCISLSRITIPSSVISIEKYAFYHCDNLSCITFSEGLTSIGLDAFTFCSSLSEITIPSSVTNIGSAFDYCSNLKKVLFMINDKDTTISIDNYVFGLYVKPTIYCYMNTAPDTFFSRKGFAVVYIDDINTVRRINLPEDFSMICGEKINLVYDIFPADGATVTWFSSDPSILNIENDTVTALNPGTATVTAMVGTAFDSVTIKTHLPATGLVLNKSELWLQTNESIQLTIASYIPENAVARSITWKSSDTTRATVNSNGYVMAVKPGDVTITATTEKGATASCVLHLTYPVSSVRLEPVSATLKIREILQLTVTTVTSNTSYTNKLVSFTSSDEDVAIVDANGLVKAVGPGAVTITATSTNGKSATSKITVQNVSLPYDLYYLYDNAGKQIGLEIRNVDKDVESLTIPDNVTSIGEAAFSGCSNLTSVTIPSSITNISKSAFSGCNNLKSITLPNGVKTISNNVVPDNCKLICGRTSTTAQTVSKAGYSFRTPGTNYDLRYLYNNIGTQTGLEILNVDKGTRAISIIKEVTSIGNSAFSGCSSLTSVTIPDGVTNIGSSAFSGCNSLANVTLPNGVKSIGNNAIPDNCKLICGRTSTTAQTVSKAGYSFRTSGTNYNLRYLYDKNGTQTGLELVSVDKGTRSIKVLKEVTSISSSAFSGCSSLTSVTIQTNVTNIGSGAFSSCPNLKEVYFTNSDRDASISFGSELFSNKPTIYCYKNTAPDTYFTMAGYKVVYLDAITQPKLIAAYNSAKGIGVKFFKVDNAEEYVIYRKFNGVWGSICTVSATDPNLLIEGDRIMFFDTSVVKDYGKGFIYSVAAKKGSEITTYDTLGAAIYRLTPPKLTKITNSANGTATVTWTSVFGSTETNGAYDLQFATEADAKASTSNFVSVIIKPGYAFNVTSTTVSGLKKGTKYVFRIRCSKTNKDRGTYYSEYSPWMSVIISK